MQHGIERNAAPVAALLLRLTLGIVFIAHGLFKVTALTLPETAQFFEHYGFPGWTAYLVFGVELFGGVLLLTGVRVRWASLALLPVVAGAFKVHWPNGWYFGARDGGWEYLGVLAVALLVQIALGAGAFALETAWSARRNRQDGKRPRASALQSSLR